MRITYKHLANADVGCKICQKRSSSWTLILASFWNWRELFSPQNFHLYVYYMLNAMVDVCVCECMCVCVCMEKSVMKYHFSGFISYGCVYAVCVCLFVWMYRRALSTSSPLVMKKRKRKKLQNMYNEISLSSHKMVDRRGERKETRTLYVQIHATAVTNGENKRDEKKRKSVNRVWCASMCDCGCLESGVCNV